MVLFINIVKKITLFFLTFMDKHSTDFIQTLYQVLYYRLHSVCNITFTIKDNDGHPVRAYVETNISPYGILGKMSDSEGKVCFYKLLAGDHEFTISSSGYNTFISNISQINGKMPVEKEIILEKIKN